MTADYSGYIFSDRRRASCFGEGNPHHLQTVKFFSRGNNPSQSLYYIYIFRLSLTPFKLTIFILTCFLSFIIYKIHCHFILYA